MYIEVKCDPTDEIGEVLEKARKISNKLKIDVLVTYFKENKLEFIRIDTGLRQEQLSNIIRENQLGEEVYYSYLAYVDYDYHEPYEK